MKYGLVTLVAGIVLLASMQVSRSATANFVKNGIDWGTNYYNPDVIEDTALYDKLPTATGQTFPVWAVNSKTAGTIPAIIENYLRISTSGTQLDSYKTSVGFDPLLTGSLTVETRLRVVSVASGSTRAGSFVLNLGGYWIDFNISGTSIGTSAESSLLTGLNLSEWTTIRFTIVDATTAPTLAIYLNNSATPSATTTKFNTGASVTSIIFGDASGSTATGGVMDWDYIAWSSSGAVAPVPEPAGQAMLGVSGIMAVFALRRLIGAKSVGR